MYREFTNTLQIPCLHHFTKQPNSIPLHSALLQAASCKRLWLRVYNITFFGTVLPAYVGTRRRRGHRSHDLRPIGYGRGFAPGFLRHRKKIAGTSQPRVHSSPCSSTSTSKSSPEKNSASSPGLNEFRQREAFNVLTVRGESMKNID